MLTSHLLLKLFSHFFVALFFISRHIQIKRLQRGIIKCVLRRALALEKVNLRLSKIPIREGLSFLPDIQSLWEVRKNRQGRVFLQKSGSHLRRVIGGWLQKMRNNGRLYGQNAAIKPRLERIQKKDDRTCSSFAFQPIGQNLELRRSEDTCVRQTKGDGLGHRQSDPQRRERGGAFGHKDRPHTIPQRTRRRSHLVRQILEQGDEPDGLPIIRCPSTRNVRQRRVRRPKGRKPVHLIRIQRQDSRCLKHECLRIEPQIPCFKGASLDSRPQEESTFVPSKEILCGRRVPQCLSAERSTPLKENPRGPQNGGVCPAGLPLLAESVRSLMSDFDFLLLKIAASFKSPAPCPP